MNFDKKDDALRILFFITSICLIIFFVWNGSRKDVNQQFSDMLQQEQLDQENSNMFANSGKKYQVVLKTSVGDITIELNNTETPNTVANFVKLSGNNFYDGTIFHRVIKGFMIQGGDPKGDGTGGPGYSFDDEKFSGDYVRGAVAMANAGPNTNGSQFFIMHNNVSLPKNYTIFGKVISGMDVVDKIAESPVESSAMGEMSKPVNPVKILSTQVIEVE